MIDKTISQYPVFCRCTAFRKAERDPAQRDKILARLGEGGMSSFSRKYDEMIPHAGGVVYKAEDTKLERVVAIKFLPHHIAASADERERFKVDDETRAELTQKYGRKNEQHQTF